MSRRRKNRNKSKSLYIWHRYAGLIAALFVVFLSVTGIALNHTDDLGLKKQHISSTLLLDRYNIQSPANIRHFSVKKRAINQADDFLFINEHRITTIEPPIIGAVLMADYLVIATLNKLLIINSDNELIETLRAIDQVPNNMSRIGTYNNVVYLQANRQLFQLDNEFTIKQITTNKTIVWSKQTPLSMQDKANLIKRYKSNIISLETVILDIHSGRFFGTYGTWFFDFIGAILIFLSTTGVIIWLKQRLHNQA